MPSSPPFYRLLALDIDGTLVDLGDKIGERTLAALAKAQARGVEIMLCTGRRYSRALPIARRLNLHLPLVTASGALIKSPATHETLFQAQIRPAVLLPLLAYVHDRGFQPILYTDSFGLGYDFHLAEARAKSPELAEFLSLNADSIRLSPDLMTSPPADVFAGFVMGTADEMRDLAANLERLWPGELYVHVIRSPRYFGYMCEIAPAGVSKWSGVQYVARQLQLSPAQICAVGDDVNDLPMLTQAGLGVAMGNAPPDVRAQASRVTGKNTDEGLLQVVDWLLGEGGFA
ncbi:MAG: Cof-type HAD-IIB family hydrolase [Pirellulales bacterium]|nr:Cof-type HAD-IIB family hydrolase [Pirellulales bacterium]